MYEDGPTRAALKQFSEDYVKAQDSVELAESLAPAVLDIILTVVLTATTAVGGTVIVARAGQSLFRQLGRLLVSLGKALKKSELSTRIASKLSNKPERFEIRRPEAQKLSEPKRVERNGNNGRMGGPSDVPNKINMRRADDLMGVEPVSPELISAVSKKRDVVIAQPGSEELRMLDYFGAEASVGGDNNTHILLRENPSKAALLEEFLHGTQSKLGITDRLGTSGLGSAETHVKDFMIRHQKMLGLGDETFRYCRYSEIRGCDNGD